MSEKMASCILQGIKVPDSIMNEINHTTALMGRQTDEWDGKKITWSYHPDNCLNAVIIEPQ